MTRHCGGGDCPKGKMHRKGNGYDGLRWRDGRSITVSTRNDTARFLEGWCHGGFYDCMIIVMIPSHHVEVARTKPRNYPRRSHVWWRPVPPAIIRNATTRFGSWQFDRFYKKERTHCSLDDLFSLHGHRAARVLGDWREGSNSKRAHETTEPTSCWSQRANPPSAVSSS